MRPILLLLCTTLALCAADGLQVSVDTGDELHLLSMTREHEPVVVLRSAVAISGELRLGIRRLSSNPVALGAAQAVELPADGELRLAVPGGWQDRYGIVYLDWELRVGDSLERGVTSFALCEPIPVTPGFQPGEMLFGNCQADTRPHIDPEWRRKLLSIARRSGAESVRVGIPWRFMQRTADGEIDFSGVDTALAQAEEQGMQLQFLIAYGGAEWTKSPETMARVQASGNPKLQWRYPPRPELWREWVRALAERYGERVVYWEIWNEPDLGFFKGSAEEYANLLKIANEVIREVAPKAKVILGGIGAMDHREHNPKLHELAVAEGNYHLHGYHRHGTFNRLYREYHEKLQPLRERLGVTAPLYFNETAMGREFAREYDQCRNAVAKMAWCWSIGAEAWHWFVTFNRHAGSSGNSYRMFHTDFTPRPIFIAYGVAARLMRGRSYAVELDLGAGRLGYGFRGKGEFVGEGDQDWVAVLWKDDDRLADEPLIIAVGAGASAQLVDMMGNAEDLPVVDGRVAVTVAWDPQFLVVTDASEDLRCLGPLLAAADRATIFPGEATTIAVAVTNPFTEARELSVAWSADAPLVIGGAPESVTLAAEETRTIEVQLSVPVGTDMRFQDTYHLRAEARVAGAPWLAELAIPVARALVVPAGSPEGRLPDIELAREGDIVNTAEALPGTEHLVWKGPQDLSAKMWLWRADDALHLRVVVRDDVHLPVAVGKDMWRADSLQIALEIPGQVDNHEFGVGAPRGGGHHTWHWPKELMANPHRETRSSAVVSDGSVRYEVVLPYTAYGLSDDILETGFRFNIVVNDLDEGEMREGWARLAEGITGAKTMLHSPVIRFLAE